MAENIKNDKIVSITIEKPDTILSSLDNIGCNCGCGDKSKDIVKTPNKYLNFFKANYQLVIAFVIFFIGIFLKTNKIVEVSIFLIAYLLVSREVIGIAVYNISKGKMLDENFLMMIASIVAFIIGDYAEGVAVMLFYRVGQLTEDYAIDKSKKSITKLLDIKPTTANLKTITGYQVVKPKDLKVGNIIIVKPGEKVPADGVVVKGSSALDVSAITGESLPVMVEEDSKVYGGTINFDGVLEVKVLKTSKDSTVSKILKLVEKANRNKAKTEKFITKFAKIYTPTVVVLAGIISILPPILLNESFSTWIYRGAIFLVVSCPCALVISVPLGYFGGIGGAAKAGVLVKGGNYLESLKNASTVVFDKTGTLTKGNFKLENIQVFEEYTEEEVLKFSSHLEMFSNHPIAKSIVKEYDGELDNNFITEVKEIPGKGLKGIHNLKDIMIGNEALLLDENIKVDKHNNGTTLYLVLDKKVIGILSINDEIKEFSKKGLDDLKQLGIKRIVMLTGDRDNIARNIGNKLGITEIHSELLPEDKLNHLEEIIKTSDGKVIFVGDGINDAPVLTRADVGIAMGALGSDAAIESADVVLMTDEITKVSEGIKISRFTSKIIYQNIIIALMVKAVIMILATLGIANMWLAVFGDVGVAFIAILNSGRAIFIPKINE